MAAKRITKRIRTRPANAGLVNGDIAGAWPSRAGVRSTWDRARWLATGTLVAYSAVGAAKPVLAQQQNAAASGGSAQNQTGP